MKSIFDKETRDELINRINKLDENSNAQWGKMNVYQMMKHVTLFDEMVLGKKKYKRVFMGRFIDKMILKNILKNENPLQRNIPTMPELKIIENNCNVTSEKNKWIALIEEYARFSNSNFIHPFFR